MVDLQGKLTDCLGRVNCRTTANCDDCFRLIAQELLNSVCDLVDRCIRYNIVENIIFLTSFFQRSGNQINHFALHYKWVCNDQNSFVWNVLKTFQCIVPKMNRCFHFKGLHICCSLSMIACQDRGILRLHL